MARSIKITIVSVVIAIAAGLAAYTAVAFVASNPPTVDFTSGHATGQPVNLTLQTDGAYGHSPHDTWVTYMTLAPSGQWVHTTLWQLPAHTRINVTIYQYDSGSPLRNQQIGRVTGTIGGDMLLNGKPTKVINANVGAGVGHTFSVPSLGINVPLAGVGNPNVCGASPCAPTWPHNTVKFSFTTPKAGQYRWQCFVPCAAGWLFGNGGPMQTVGYMDGFLKVVD